MSSLSEPYLEPARRLPRAEPLERRERILQRRSDAAQDQVHDRGLAGRSSSIDFFVLVFGFHILVLVLLVELHVLVLVFAALILVAFLLLLLLWQHHLDPPRQPRHCVLYGCRGLAHFPQFLPVCVLKAAHHTAPHPALRRGQDHAAVRRVLIAREVGQEDVGDGVRGLLLPPGGQRCGLGLGSRRRVVHDKSAEGEGKRLRPALKLYP